jgi:hypothetical protein
MSAAGLSVVIGSFLEEEQVRRIAAAPAAGRVSYEPGLLPVPRYPCDHTAPPRDLAAADLDRWRALSAAADVYFDFDWPDPGGMADHSPGLRWIQATSAGIGGFMQRHRARQRLRGPGRRRRAPRADRGGGGLGGRRLGGRGGGGRVTTADRSALRPAAAPDRLGIPRGGMSRVLHRELP